MASSTGNSRIVLTPATSNIATITTAPSNDDDPPATGVKSGFISFGKHQMENVPRTLFVARTRGFRDSEGFKIQTKDEVIPALNEMKAAFERELSQKTGIGYCSSYVIEHALSSQPFLYWEPVRGMFFSLLTDMECQDRPLNIVVNGWEGLTTNTYSFLDLFWGKLNRVKLFVYAGDPPSYGNSNATFHKVNLLDTCLALLGQVEEKTLDRPTRRFLWYFRAWPMLEIEMTGTWPHIIYGGDLQSLTYTPPIIDMPGV